MDYKVIEIEGNLGIEKYLREELKIEVRSVKDDFKIFDVFYLENGDMIKVYKNSEDVYYFTNALDNIFNKESSHMVPAKVINNRVQTSDKYKFNNLYKLDTANPFDNYLVSKYTLVKMIGLKYTIVDEPKVAHGFRIYNE